MDFGIQLIILVLFGVTGFIMEKIVGINTYRLFSDLIAAFFLIAMIGFITPAMLNPDIAVTATTNMVNFFVDSLPSIVIGDIAGSVIAEITG